jgi:hypothetical protein
MIQVEPTPVSKKEDNMQAESMPVEQQQDSGLKEEGEDQVALKDMDKGISLKMKLRSKPLNPRRRIICKSSANRKRKINGICRSQQSKSRPMDRRRKASCK